MKASRFVDTVDRKHFCYYGRTTTTTNTFVFMFLYLLWPDVSLYIQAGWAQPKKKLSQLFSVFSVCVLDMCNNALVWICVIAQVEWVKTSMAGPWLHDYLYEMNKNLNNICCPNSKVTHSFFSDISLLHKSCKQNKWCCDANKQREFINEEHFAV